MLSADIVYIWAIREAKYSLKFYLFSRRQCQSFDKLDDDLTQILIRSLSATNDAEKQQKYYPKYRNNYDAFAQMLQQAKVLTWTKNTVDRGKSEREMKRKAGG